MIFNFGSYVLDIDVDRTRAFYGRPDVKTTSEQCVCTGCQNYDAAILLASPKVLNFFESLGIDPRKPAEVYDLLGGDPDEAGTMYYNGWYHVCGVRLQGDDAWVNVTDEMKHLEFAKMYAVDDSFKVSFEEGTLMLHKAFPSPVLQMEIDAHLPWVLPNKGN